MELKLSMRKRFFVRVSNFIKSELNNLVLDSNVEITSYKCRKAYEESFLEGCEKASIEDYLVDKDNCLTFSKLVKATMEKKGITSKDIYKNTLINRKLFSALNVNDDYIPSRETAIMYCIALKLNYEESDQLLKSAGYSFYEYSNFDKIIKYFLDKKIYNIDTINDALYCYTKKCLGYR